ncbi:MAG: PDC sensor domain-containing protein [Pseudomonadota bacterium]
MRRTPSVALSPILLVATLFLFAASLFLAGQARAELPGPLQAKVETYKKKLVEWAANPAIVQAVKDANAKGGTLPGMTNGKWDELAENDPQITALLATPASKLVKQWEADKGINKLFVRDEKGNMVAGSGKSLIYNAAARPPVKEAMKGKAWAANEAKPDPTTQINSVHVSAPVMDGGKVIGVIHTAVTAD